MDERLPSRRASKGRVNVQVNHPTDPPAVAEPPRELEAPDDNPKG